MSGLTPETTEYVRKFIALCREKPNTLYLPELSFFREYLISLNAKLPDITTPESETPPTPTMESGPAEVDSEPESDLELDMEGCVEPDKISASQVMPEVKGDVSEEDSDKADEKRGEAMAAFSEQNFEKAIELFTEALTLNPSSALLYAKRGQTFLKLNKPNACIQDCNRALELNCDSAAAFKFRGRAHRLLGNWEQAAVDLRQACNIDFDEQTDEWLREVTPNARKLEQHKLKIERKRAEKDLKEKQERLRRAREANAKAAAANASAEANVPPDSGKGNDFYEFMKDPEIREAFSDPEVAAAFTDITSNPANFLKYQSNPKIAAIINKLTSKFQSGGGMPGFPGMGGMGGFPGGFPGGAPGAGGFSSGPNGDDIGLD